MTRLLVATDFSARSDRALRRATLIARKVRGSLTLVHVVDADRADSMIEADQAAASGLLAAAASTLKNGDQIDADWLVTVDDVHAGVLAAGDKIDADLIVIGPHRRRVGDVFVGTTAERLVRRTTRPLLVAVDVPAADYRHTLLALDFDQASKAAGRRALELGVFDHTDVVIMHAFDAAGEMMLRRSMISENAIERYITTESQAAAEKLRALIAELRLPPASQSVVTMTGSPARTILESAQTAGSELIVLGTNQRKGFVRALIGSVTEDVIRDAKRDVLIIPTDEPE